MGVAGVGTGKASKRKGKDDTRGERKTGVRRKTLTGGKVASKPSTKSSEVAQPAQAQDASWKHRFVRSQRGEIVSCPANVILLLTNDPSWKGLLQFNELIGDVTVTRPPHWPKDMVPGKRAVASGTLGDQWTESDMTRLGAWMAQRHGLVAATGVICEAVRVVAERQIVHPIRDWLSALKWDRKARIDDVFIRLAHSPDTPYVRAVGSKFFIGAVARIFEPGCQVDTMPILEGEQGIGKTSFIKALCGASWFLSTKIDIGHKDAYQVLARKWIVEFGELDALTRAEISTIKQYISQSIDTYRASFGKVTLDHPRQQVFVGTVNPEGGGYLKDNTGARRFQPLPCGGPNGDKKIDVRDAALEREQIWAEAVYRYRKGEKWYITERALLKEAAEVAEERRQAHPWEALIAKWLYDSKHPERARDGVTTNEILARCLHQEKGKMGRGDEMQIAAILRLVGWTRIVRKRHGGIVFRSYLPVTTSVPTSPSDPTSNVIRLDQRRPQKGRKATAKLRDPTSRLDQN